MLEFWKSKSYATKFSIVGFIISAALGLLSMGLLGFGLYYTVSFIFRSYPDINSWHGDWVWPALIMVGMFWSLGFLFAGIVWHYFAKSITSIVALRTMYIITLWLWTAFLWYMVISSNKEALSLA